ncbi:MAG TPA: hypothetical protein VF945_01235 [Polyangia bacterium]
MIKSLMTVAGLAGTLGVAAPAFADWDDQPRPIYNMPVQQQPGYAWGYDGDEDRDGWRRREEWRRHEAWEHYRRWHRWEWMRHHRWGYPQNW